jgi:glycosyltransferase involved in cell wall biosynthesis
VGKAAIICQVDPFLYKGGIETYIRNVIDLLESRNIFADIYHTDLVEGTHGFHDSGLGKLYLTGKKVMEKETEYEFIISNSFYGLGYFPPGKKTFNVYHATHSGLAEALKSNISASYYYRLKRLYGEIGEGESGFLRKNIAVSGSVCKELQEFYGFKEVETVPHGIDTNIFQKRDKARSREKWGIPADAFVGIYAGRWENAKGSDVLETLIGSYSGVVWVLALATGGRKPSLPEREEIIILQEVDQKSMSEIYSGADFLLFPSLYEGFGFAIAEAMACELPVITTKVGIAKSIYSQQPFRLMALPDMVAYSGAFLTSCVGKIEILKGNPALSEVLGKLGRQIVEQSFSLSLWKKRMTEILGLC